MRFVVCLCGKPSTGFHRGTTTAPAFLPLNVCAGCGSAVLLSLLGLYFAELPGREGTR